MKLRVILVEKPNNAYWNIALEEAIPRCVSLKLSPPTLRFYRNANAVIIGVFQFAEKEVDLDFARKNKIQVVRRFTGGGAVYHDMGNLNYAVSLPKEFKVPTDMVEYYRFFIDPIVNVLRKLGVENANIGKLNDINIGNRKIGGTAASRRWNVSFFHGTLLVNTNIDILANVLKVPGIKLKDKGVKTIKERVINLSEVIPDVKIDELMEEIAEEYSKHLGLDFEWKEISEVELRVADMLYELKYSKDEWNLKRAPMHYYDELIQEKLKRVVR